MWKRHWYLIIFPFVIWLMIDVLLLSPFNLGFTSLFATPLRALIAPYADFSLLLIQMVLFLIVIVGLLYLSFKD